MPSAESLPPSPEKTDSSRNLGGRAAWGRVCGRAKLLAGTLRCLRLVGDFLGIGRTRNGWGVAPNPSRDAVPAPCKGHCPLTRFLCPGLSALQRRYGIAAVRLFLHHSPHQSPNLLIRDIRIQPQRRPLVNILPHVLNIRHQLTLIGNRLPLEVNLLRPQAQQR